MPPANEQSPLLGHSNGVNHAHSYTFIGKVKTFIKAEGQPGWLKSFRWFIFGSWINILLVFIPLSFISHFLNMDAALRFVFSFIAIVPLAKLLGDATEQMSMSLGQTVAGLLNASFGNAVEIIVGITALLHDELRIVQTSLIGSVLSNVLLVLGCSFLAGGLKYDELHFQKVGAQVASSLMTLSCVALVIPAAYSASISSKDAPDALAGLLVISRGTALILLAVYIIYIYFQLVSHNHVFQEEEGELEEEQAEMSTVAATVALFGVTIITSFCADYLVAAIDETATRYQIPKAFIGLILLPIVANAAEHVTSVWMAMKNKTGITIGVCVGSSIQNAALVIPALVILGWMTGHQLTLFFEQFETIIFFISIILVNSIIQDGKANYMEGILLLALYLIIALAFWVS